MPSLRWLPLLSLFVILAGCDDRAVQQRADQIRKLSDHEDRAYTAEAVSHIERKYWTVRGHTWYGKLQDGNILRLQAPRATAAPLPSQAFYSGWHLQLTISAQEWGTLPPSEREGTFEVVYAITRHSATAWDIRVSDGPVTSPLHHEDAGRLRDEN
jgi:hypothetical protein